MGRVTALTRPDTQVTRFQYDPKGNLTGLTPPGRPEHPMDHSPVDLESGYTPPQIDDGTGAIVSGYNKDRDLTRRSHLLGPYIDYGYDGGGRMSSRTTEEGIQHYTYVGNTERIASVTTPAGERLDFGYDGPLPISSRWSGTVNASLITEWNADFDIAAHTVEGRRIDYQYDRDGRLTRAGDMSLTRHGGHGAVTATTLGTINTTRQYNLFGETRSNSATGLYQAQYQRDKLGRITQKTETIENQNHTYDYRYDAAGRLVEEKTDGTLTGSWGYDPNGDRTQHNQDTAGSYDEQDRLASYRQTHNRPIPRGEIQYVIDGQERRIGKKLDGQLIQGFLYQDQLNPVAELDGEGNLKALFVLPSVRSQGYLPRRLGRGEFNDGRRDAVRGMNR